MSKDKLQAKLNDATRREMLKIAKSHTNLKGSSHANFQEFEADRYAANRVGEKTMKKAMTEYTKKNIGEKSIDEERQAQKRQAYQQAKIDGTDTSYLDLMYSDGNTKQFRDASAEKKRKEANADLGAREGALKDKRMKNSKIYK
jgi:hypothetical protein